MSTQFKYNPPPQTLFSINQNSVECEKNTINFHAGVDKMLSIGPDGFYVRGVKVEQDEDEAAKVYESFKQWLVWAQLNKS
jgi:hypothetical protein